MPYPLESSGKNDRSILPPIPGPTRAEGRMGFALAALLGPLLVGFVALTFGQATLAPAAFAQNPRIIEEDLVESPPPATAPRVGADSGRGTAVPEELRELERLADEAFAQDELDTALALYRQLADRHQERSEKVRAMMTVAWLEHLRGQRVSTILVLTDVLVLEPDYDFRPELYSDDFIPLFYEARERAVQTREAEATRMVSEGSSLLRQRRTAEARERFEKALAIWPDLPRARYNLALADYYDGRSEEALTGFQKLLSLDAARPGSVDAEIRGLALTNLGLVYLDQGLDGEAADVLKRAVTEVPENGAAWSNLGVALRRMGQSPEAIRAFREAWRLDPDDVDTARNLALAHLDAGDPASAESLLRDATGRFPNDAGLWLYYGLALERQGNRAGARGAYENAIARDPANDQEWAASAALQLAAVAFAQRDPRASLAHATRVVEWRPEEINGWVYQGLARQATGDLQGAVESLEEARRREPTRADIHNSLGSVYFGLRRLADAAAAFERALQLRPDLRSARDNLAKVNAVERGEATLGGTRTAGSGTRQSPTRTTTRPQPTRQRPSLGLRFADIDYASLGLTGAMVEKVFADSAAARAGLRPDDLLLRMDGRSITDGEALRAYFGARPAGSEVVIELLRANRPLTVRLKVP